ncbi:YezD family protein [Sphingorhabdus sp.]|uniref:YezD family protein n=1 Tax=Sphingorhabdus sp. TaxID=1902408 RepID=UPI0032B7E624
MANANEDRETESRKGDAQPALQSVLDALGRLKFGAIQLTVHEGKLVQVDVTERQRFSN